MPFTGRPDQLAAKDRQIENLEDTLSTVQMSLQQLQAERAVWEDAAPTPTEQEVLEKIEVLEFCLAKEFDKLTELTTPKMKRRFEVKGRMDLYCHLVNLQRAIYSDLGKQHAECAYQLWCIKTEGNEACIDEATQAICDELNESPVEDLICAKITHDIIDKNIQ